VGIGQLSIEVASPSFISSYPTREQAHQLTSASNLAKRSFAFYLRAHRLVDTIRFGKRPDYHPELRGIESQ
jgi:hypothetical protein